MMRRWTDVLLWDDEHPEYHGRFADFACVDAHPRPVQQPIPLVVGGNTPPACRRAIARGNGWYGYWLTAEDVASSLTGLRTAADRVERIRVISRCLAEDARSGR